MRCKVDTRQLRKLEQNLKQMTSESNLMLQEIIEQISNEFIENVKKKTPSSETDKLKNNWKKEVRKTSNGYEVKIYNDILYASEIEYGHKINGGSGWKQGSFMMTITEQMIETRLNKLAQEKMNKMLKEVF